MQPVSLSLARMINSKSFFSFNFSPHLLSLHTPCCHCRETQRSFAMNSQSQQSRHFARKYSTAHLAGSSSQTEEKEHGRNITKSVRKKDFRTCKRLNWFAIEFDMRKAEIYLFTLSFQLLLFRHASFLRPLPKTPTTAQLLLRHRAPLCVRYVIE